jgi:hypothetical protein
LTSSQGQPIANGSPGDSTKPADQPKEANRGVRRAARLKALRPELAASIRRSISHVDALKIGGYKNRKDMDNDLDARDAAAAIIEARQAAAAKLARSRSEQPRLYQTSTREFTTRSD